MNNFTSDLITLNDVVEKCYLFNIPIYQRLYVWGREQIHILLDDLVSACQARESTFYLGGTIVTERENIILNNRSYPVFDLIDGQQRFTTLWLISVVLKELLTDYSQVETGTGVHPRISFSIRPEVTLFFEKLYRNESGNLPEAKMLEDALEEIRAYFHNYSTLNTKTLNKFELTRFIRHNVKLILTKVPSNTDLNNLFEVINNRGVQLQHHEILKARLLQKLPEDEREVYSLLWDASSHMNDYLERNLRRTTGVDLVTLYESSIHDPLCNFGREALADPVSVIAALRMQKAGKQCEPTALASILMAATSFTSDVTAKTVPEDDESLDPVNSIITFSMLLQHVLRIYLQKTPGYPCSDINKVSDKDLLALFDMHWLIFEPESTDIKMFIELLWQVRYLFDKHVIKWVSVEGERVHAIRRLYINRSRSRNSAYLQRQSRDAEPDFALLQSMLYHSQQMTTHYWLTPLLNFLLAHSESNAFLYLCHLDNHLLCSEPDASLIERTLRYLVEPWHKETLLDANTSLNQHFDNGTQYPHYWFYKLEFVLYLKLKEQGESTVERFRMTAKNSVEHITPQNPEKSTDSIPDDLLHNFGNLALVTRSLNSEMSNKGFSIKKAEFEERHRGQGISLKLEDIYANTRWRESEINLHLERMIHSLNDYLMSVERQVRAL
ncbi:DUF262 domain-containing protein [Pectobacterium brasiliense]|uniref:DUF262 domain-containing protein n=1 Tax=Pectobacterium brasiliense TaxID=180957 RepID=UPI001968DD76|nr:DUF262 domain-containing protein [Pectobacterium brasiliense]MBN3253669.1 DUF262 domain-containing protein [Pectobacterium brasiliense]